MEQQIRARLEQAIGEKVFPGAVVGVLEEGGLRTIIPVGRFVYDLESSPVQPDTMYDTASITKTVPVGLLALKYIEEGKISLDDQVIKYLPEISIPDRERGLIRHLLTYTYILKKNADPNYTAITLTKDDIFQYFFTREFAYLPGTHYEYTNVTTNLLGLILERISGERLYRLATERILAPLEMNSSTFSPADPQSIPPTEVTDWRGEVRGVVHDEQAFILQRAGENPGCAGLFAPADDLLNVLEMVLGKGEFKGKNIFKEETVVLMETNALENIDASSAMGWELNQALFMGSYCHEHMFGKTGFTGTSMVGDPRTHRALVLLSNCTYPKRGVREGINAVRRDIADIVFV